jgi:hypothetical protein
VSLPKCIYGVGLGLSVTHVSNDPPTYTVEDRSELVCTCSDEARAVSIARALAFAALAYEITIGAHVEEWHR